MVFWNERERDGSGTVLYVVGVLIKHSGVRQNSRVGAREACIALSLDRDWPTLMLFLAALSNKGVCTLVDRETVRRETDNITEDKERRAEQGQTNRDCCTPYVLYRQEHMSSLNTLEKQGKGSQ